MALLDSSLRRSVPEPPRPHRTAPHSIEAEQALLGAILVNNQAFDRVSDFLEPRHFFEPAHQAIYEVAGSLIRRGKVADTTTLKTFLPPDVEIASLTLDQYLARLAAEATTIINAVDYGRTIYDLFIRRSLISVGEDMVNVAYDAPVDFEPKAQIEDAERKLYELVEFGKYGNNFQQFKTALTTAVDMAAQAKQRDTHLSGIATGFRKLDLLMGGLQKSDVIVIAGRPGMGKTAFATNIAYNAAHAFKPKPPRADGKIEAADGGRVGFFSLEMSAEQLATRIISEQADISSAAMRRGQITDSDFDKIVEFSRMMESLPLYIDETGGLSIAQLVARARRLKRQRAIDLLIIDYIQLVQGSLRRGSDNRVQEVTEITTSLKALAKELDVPIIALSQLSRQVENRDDKHPQLSDLRESGSIEQDADVVLFVFRQEYYLTMKQPREKDESGHTRQEYLTWDNEFRDAKGKAEIIIAKQRHGPTGTVNLHFNGEFTRFTSLAEDEEIPEPRPY
jgi:replicative DNA helicase